MTIIILIEIAVNYHRLTILFYRNINLYISAITKGVSQSSNMTSIGSKNINDINNINIDIICGISMLL